jgi:lipopolysaccharide biosynthesis glycosyltransferase
MRLEIACGATENYLPHLGVMLHSLLRSTPSRPLRIHLMVSMPLLAEQHDRLLSVVQPLGGQLELLHISDRMLEGLPTAPGFHRSIWHRVLLPDLLPQVPRILYLDADMVITDDLRPLWETPLGDHLYAAVAAPFYPGQSSAWVSRLGVPVESYISSGVLLMDLEGMRREGAVAAIRAYAASHPDNPAPEQDALNALFHRRCLRVHPRWNVQPIFYDINPGRFGAQAREATQAPAVVHFAGPAKPWHYLSRHPLRRLYFDHLRQTPWPMRPLEGRSWRNRLLRLVPPRWQFIAFRITRILMP